VLDTAWREFEEALVWQPLVPLYCVFGFCWQRTWDRPFVPDLEAVPAADRDYYERHGCFQFNNPGLNDLGKDVLFDLITRESGAKMAADMDREVLPRMRALIERLAPTAATEPVFRDLRWGVYVVLEAPTPYAAACFAQYGLRTDATSTWPLWCSIPPSAVGRSTWGRSSTPHGGHASMRSRPSRTSRSARRSRRPTAWSSPAATSRTPPTA